MNAMKLLPIATRGFAIKAVFVVFGTLLICTPIAVLAQGTEGYVSLTELPRVAENSTDLVGFLNAIYIVLIGLGSLIAVVKIAIAGVKYTMSDVITDKTSAKRDIQGALIGLAILLVPFLILNTIYPGLTNLDILNRAPRTSVESSLTSGTRLGVNEIAINEATPEELEEFINNCPKGSEFERGFNEDGVLVGACAVGEDPGAGTQPEIPESYFEDCADSDAVACGSEFIFIDGQPVATPNYSGDKDNIFLYCDVDDDACNNFCIDNAPEDPTILDNGLCEISPSDSP